MIHTENVMALWARFLKPYIVFTFRVSKSRSVWCHYWVAHMVSLAIKPRCALLWPLLRCRPGCTKQLLVSFSLAILSTCISWFVILKSAKNKTVENFKSLAWKCNTGNNFKIFVLITAENKPRNHAISIKLLKNVSNGIFINFLKNNPCTIFQ